MVMVQSQALVMLNLFQHNALPSPVILKRVQDDEVLNNFVSRRGAEIAEAAEISELQGFFSSAHSAISAPLRETHSALWAGANA
jgi:hypothetical protein